MAYVQEDSVSITTSAGGAGEAYLSFHQGRIAYVGYEKHGSTPYDNGIDLDVTLERTGEVIWSQDDVNASDSVAPLRQAQDTLGVDIAGFYMPLYIGEGDRVKISIAQGGNTKIGTFRVKVV
jgi:hypothetical protein